MLFDHAVFRLIPDDDHLISDTNETQVCHFLAQYRFNLRDFFPVIFFLVRV